MAQILETRSGLQATPRQCWIFGLYAAVVMTATVFVPKQGTGSLNSVPMLQLLSPWLLGLALIVFDRPGPLRNWLAPLLLSLFYPIAALWYDAASIADWARFGHPPQWIFAAALNVICLGGFAIYLRSLYPTRCPECDRRALIPLLRLGKQEKRTNRTRWCACCGVQLWRGDSSEWQRERRQTWLTSDETPVDRTAPHCMELERPALDQACCHNAQ